MDEIILLKLGELVLKGLNRRSFEDKLIGNARRRLKDLLAESAEVNRRMAETVSALVKGQETFAAAGQPLPNYEVPVPKDSPLIGKSIGELQFWQSTGGTIVAIRRGQTVILSPGPYAELYGGDVIILAGKGHEDYQEINHVHYPMDERVIVADYLKKQG